MTLVEFLEAVAVHICDTRCMVTMSLAGGGVGEEKVASRVNFLFDTVSG